MACNTVVCAMHTWTCLIMKTIFVRKVWLGIGSSIDVYESFGSIFRITSFPVGISRLQSWRTLGIRRISFDLQDWLGRFRSKILTTRNCWLGVFWRIYCSWKHFCSLSDYRSWCRHSRKYCRSLFVFWRIYCSGKCHTVCSCCKYCCCNLERLNHLGRLI